MKPIEWTETHQREAARRLYEIAAALAGKGDELRAMEVSAAVSLHIDERHFRDILFDPPGADMGIEQIEREVQRVDRLARGEWVRERGDRWHVRLRDADGEHTSESMCEAMARHESRSVTNPNVRANVLRVCVTRIRKARP